MTLPDPDGYQDQVDYLFAMDEWWAFMIAERTKERDEARELARELALEVTHGGMQAKLFECYPWLWQRA